MNRTILLGTSALLIGLALATSGTVLLGSARAVARQAGSVSRRARADVAQYGAAIAALLGFLTASAAGALLASELIPLSGPPRLVVAAILGVLLFVVFGAFFSRIADRAEEARAQRIPVPPYNAARYGPVPTRSGPRTEPTVLSPPGQPSPPPYREAVPDLSSRTDTEVNPPPEGMREVRPGWIYQDAAGSWFLGMVRADSGHPGLLTLPEFGLVDGASVACPLTLVGAGELSIVPLVETEGDETGSPSPRYDAQAPPELDR